MFRNNLLDMVFAPGSIHVLFTANHLKIFTFLAEKEMTVEEMAGLTGSRIPFLQALLDACVSLGVLHRLGNTYQNSHVSDAYLVEGRPLYLGDIIEVQSIETGHWKKLHDLVQGRESGGDAANLEVTPELFTKAMNNLGMMGEAEALANAVDLSGCKTMIDVGCGSGIYSIALCRHYPDLHAVLLDKKDVLAITERFIKKSRLQNRLSLHAADILEDPYGSGMDAVLLSDVLYQDSSTCLKILRLAHDALTPGGILIIRGYFADPLGLKPVFGSLFALERLLFDTNRELISVATLHSWINKAGFAITASHALTERSTCILAKKKFSPLSKIR